MTLQFKTKRNQAAVDQRAMELALFLTTNSCKKWAYAEALDEVKSV